jgi:hypothetical protein
MALDDKSQDPTGQDWSKFDFTRWNLEGLQVDAAQASLAGWLRDLTVSPQWAEKMAQAVTAVQSAALPALQAHADQLNSRLGALDTELSARVADASNHIAGLEESARVAGAPASVVSDPANMQVAVKVLHRASKAGLCGLKVRLFDAKNPSTTNLAESNTDIHGNAVLVLTQEQIDALPKTGVDLTLEVLSPSDKSAFKGKVASPKANQTDTVVAMLESGKELSKHVALAKSVAAKNQALLTAAYARIDTMKAYYQQTRDSLQQELDYVNSVVSAMTQPKAPGK